MVRYSLRSRCVAGFDRSDLEESVVVALLGGEADAEI